MFFTSAFVVLAHTLSVLCSPLESRTVSSAVYDNLVFYYQYASSAYADSCARPNGNSLVKQFSNIVTDTQGFITRDDNRKEIVVALRGSSTLQDALTDVLIFLSNYESPGVHAPFGTQVHLGFLNAYNSVSDIILPTVRNELNNHSGYSLVTTGHSLGGALSSLAAASLHGNFPGVPLRMYTYGQPRTGNSVYASWINEQLGSNVFRGVHTNDSVPTVIPQFIGYRHHGVEYWTSPDPPSASTTKQCAPDGEDPTCSDSIPSNLLETIFDNPAHGVYYGIRSSTTFCT